jgi:DNA-binding CsgD family transcriptional regulator
LKNVIIDAFETIAATQNPETRRRTTQDLFESLGFTNPPDTGHQTDGLAPGLIDPKLLTAVLSMAVPHPCMHQPAAKPTLTPRQCQVLTLLASGLQNGAIAETLGITEVAVRKHFTAARRALGANTREHALAIALRTGLITELSIP